MRSILTVRNPAIEPLVNGLGIAGADLDGARAFALRLFRERNKWSVGRGGALHDRRISRHDADKELHRALAALKGGVA